jgi:starch-binding outer membrane protein, SusD/RagB family
MKQKIFTSLLVGSLLVITNCTDLEEKYGSNLTESQVAKDEQSIEALLASLDNALRVAFQTPYSDVICLSEITTDELIAPTRGTDWFDNGAWQQLDLHRWDGDHQYINECFNDLNGVVFAATDILRFSPTPQQESTARFYRALAMYWLLDFFDQVPYRDPGESTLLPARVRKGSEALEYIISEINGVMQNLPDGPVTKPNKDAAKVLLMKCYLNKGVYENRQSPTFPKNDMNEVIKLADEVINSNRYSFSNNYFDNFAPDNGTTGKENIFTQENVGGTVWEPLVIYIRGPLHYNNTPAGPNGWATISGFYDKFEPGDLRKGQVYRTPGSPLNPGNRINVGFLVGQQYDLDFDKPLKDRTGRPLIFTREVKVQETGSDLETTGIRPQKYVFDWTNFDYLDNDWVYFRLPDILLMKAEAILRDGTGTVAGPYGSTALELVNSIRLHPSRGASALTSIDLNILLDERARELWLECWRRQDLIRFGKFLGPYQEKNYTSDSKYLLFPIPNQQIAVNKYLEQNQGY